jgi:hypothetical protein
VFKLVKTRRLDVVVDDSVIQYYYVYYHSQLACGRVWLWVYALLVQLTPPTSTLTSHASIVHM